eukprot:Rmarinus@m.25887
MPNSCARSSWWTPLLHRSWKKMPRRLPSRWRSVRRLRSTSNSISKTAKNGSEKNRLKKTKKTARSRRTHNRRRSKIARQMRGRSKCRTPATPHMPRLRPTLRRKPRQGRRKSSCGWNFTLRRRRSGN